MATSSSRPNRAVPDAGDLPRPRVAWEEALAPAPRSRREARERQAAAAARAAAARCGCGTAWTADRDRCSFCGELRRSTLIGVLGWTGRHLLSGPRRDPR